jgi:hypothetical protein
MGDLHLHVFAPALGARHRPALADKHPIPATLSGDPVEVTVTHALAVAAPERDFAWVLDQLADRVEGEKRRW